MIRAWAPSSRDLFCIRFTSSFGGHVLLLFLLSVSLFRYPLIATYNSLSLDRTLGFGILAGRLFVGNYQVAHDADTLWLLPRGTAGSPDELRRRHHRYFRDQRRKEEEVKTGRSDALRKSEQHYGLY